MTIKKALVLYSNQDCDLLLSFVLKKTKEFLYLNPEYEIPKTKLIAFKKLVSQRTKGKPIAYLLGYKYFYGLRFKVTKDTLIPRPETELLIDEIINLTPLLASPIPVEERAAGSPPKIGGVRGGIKQRRFSILDIGTGSGCIAISLKKHLPHVNITASDISKKALTVAKQNAKNYKIKINFIESNLFKNIAKQKFDIIIANLPYVPITDYKILHSNLKFEPKIALTDGTINFQIFQNFFSQVRPYINQSTIILLEIDPKTKKHLNRYAKNNYSIDYFKDPRGLYRFAKIKIGPPR